MYVKPVCPYVMKPACMALMTVHNQVMKVSLRGLWTLWRHDFNIHNTGHEGLIKVVNVFVCHEVMEAT